MLKVEHKQLSLYSLLYKKIPDNHILKSINNVVDVGFINKLLEGSYCKFYGRPAKEPEMMAKLLVLQYLYYLSDERLIEEASLNLAYLWFIGVNPDDDLPTPSLLSKFRTQRLKETSIDDIIKEVVKQCVNIGLIKGTSISIDATHTSANTGKKVPERVMKHLAKKILNNLKEETGAIPETIDTTIPDYKEIEDHKVAKTIMENYINNLVESVENSIDTTTAPETKEALEKAKEVLKD